MPGFRGPRKNTETYTSLRDQAPVDGLSPAQEGYLGLFVAHVIAREMAVYVSAMPNGRGIKVRVFNGDDKYEDILGLSEQWGPVFDGYARALGGLDDWRAAVAKHHAATAPAPTGDTKPGKA